LMSMSRLFWLMLLLHDARCIKENISPEIYHRRNLREGNSGKIMSEEREHSFLKIEPVRPPKENEFIALSPPLCTIHNVLDNDDVVNNVPLGIVNKTLKAGNVTFGEKFVGMGLQSPLGVFGIQDELVPKFTLDEVTALELEPSFSRLQNIYTDVYCANQILGTECSVRVLGLGPAGDKGSGSISIYFDTDQNSLEIKFWSVGATDAVMLFYKRDGEYLGTEDVDIVNDLHYSFKREEGDIAGIAIYPKGDPLRWHKFGIIGVCVEEE